MSLHRRQSSEPLQLFLTLPDYWIQLFTLQPQRWSHLALVGGSNVLQTVTGLNSWNHIFRSCHPFELRNLSLKGWIPNSPKHLMTCTVQRNHPATWPGDSPESKKSGSVTGMKLIEGDHVHCTHCHWLGWTPDVVARTYWIFRPDDEYSRNKTLHVDYTNLRDSGLLKSRSRTTRPTCRKKH